MPLLDHFHPPLQGRRQWHSFHHAWATYLAADLNHRLPPDYYAQPNLQFGIEIDVAAFDGSPDHPAPASNWTLPAPTMTLPMALLTDIAEVEVYSTVAGPVLIGAIELVSPANKDRPATRDAFVSKCASYLQQVIGLVIVDIVTDRTADLHAALLHRISDAAANPGTSNLWAAAYRPWRVDDQTQVEVWLTPLTLGGRLPSALPFCLKNGPSLPLDLEATYMQTCRELRLPHPVNGPASG